MEIKCFTNVELASNCYIITHVDRTYIIDPGSIHMTKVLDYLEENELNVKGILLTHGHFDHMVGIPVLLEKYKVPVYISELDQEFLFNPEYSLIGYSKLPQATLEEALKGTEIINYGDEFENFTVISCPGHTRGGVSFYDEDSKILFTGDSLFKGNYGRTDFPTGNQREMMQTIQKLLKLKKDTVVYPGHGDNTTISAEYSYYYSMY